MTQKTVDIDLSVFDGPVYVGREKGKIAREKAGLDKIDKEDTHVRVNIPQDTYTINSSFFLGFFGPSIRKSGSRDNFLQKFEFTGSTEFKEVIEDCISRALYTKGNLLA